MRLEKKPKAVANGITSPRSHNVGVVRMLRLERNWRSLMRMIALCADVEVAELEGEEPWSKMPCIG